MTKLRKTSKRTSRGFCVLDFPDLRFIRAEHLFRISIFGFRIFLACALCASEVLRTTMLESLRGLGEFSKIRNISDSDIPPAKAPRTLSSDQYFFFFFAAFASLREIIRNSVAASTRWVLRGELISVFAVTMVLGLSGCLVGPDYRRPPAAIPPQFRAAMTPDAVPSIADLKWFEVFKDEHLQELIRVALVQNYDLRDAIARVDQARANLGITRSNQFPQFSLGGDVTSRELSTNGEFSIPQGSSFVNRQRTFGEGFVSLLSFEVDIWGRLRRATESAQAQLLASDWNRKTVITTLISDVATAYFNLLELDMELAIARDTLGTRDESLRLLRIQLQGGVGTLLDVRQGEQLVYTAAEVIPDDERQIEQTENQISLLLGKNPGPVARSSLIAMERPP